MTHRNSSLFFLALFFPVLLNSFSLTGAQASPTEYAPDAVRFRFTSADLQTTLEAATKAIAGAPITGSVEKPIIIPHWLLTTTLRGMDYGLEIFALHGQPAEGHIAAALQLKNVHGTVRRLELNKSGTSYCEGIDAESVDTIPVTFTIKPHVTEDQQLGVKIETVNVGLTSDNFTVYRPKSCNVLWGFNWVLRFVLPWIVSSYRTAIAEEVAEQVQTVIEQSFAELSSQLVFNITLPFHLPPLKPFYGSVDARPSKLSVAPSGLEVTYGADVAIDPDPEKRTQQPGKTAKEAPSFIGISLSAVSAILREANRSGILLVDLNPHTVPDWQHLLVVGGIKDIWPAAAERWSEDTPVRLLIDHIAQAEAKPFFIKQKPVGVGIELKGVETRVIVGGTLLGHLRLDFVLPLAWQLQEPQTIRADILQFVASRPQWQAADETFANFQEDGFQEFVRQVSQRLLDATKDHGLLALSIPKICFQGVTVKMGAINLHQDFLALDFRLQAGKSVAATHLESCLSHR